MRLLLNRGAMQCSEVFIITAFLLTVTVMLEGASTPAQAQTPTVPAAPTELTATADGPTRIVLSWIRPSDDGGAELIGYWVELSSDGGVTWEHYEELASPGGSRTIFDDYGLSAGDTRHYRVSAYNSIGRGPPSNVASATTTTTAPTVPAAPTGLTARADGPTRIALSWAAPWITGGAAISGYKIEVSADSGVTWSDLVANTGITFPRTYSHTSLSGHDTRHYRVSAWNSAGTGPASDVASTTTAAPTLPAAPPRPTARAEGATRIALSWTAPSNTGGAAISGYKIEVSADRGGNWSDLVANTGTTARTYAHTSLSARDTRLYRVSAINSVGTGPASRVARATTTAPTVPSTPPGLTARADGPPRIILSWIRPSDDGGVELGGYWIEVSSDGGATWEDLAQTASIKGSDTRSHDYGLSAGDTRHYRISAWNSVGRGPASDVASATTTTAPTVPAAPTGLTARADGPTRIALSWTAPWIIGGAAISGYKIEVSADSGTTWSDLVANTGNAIRAYHDYGLSARDTRHYRVSAINSAGTGPASDVASGTTTGPTLSAAPTELTARADGATRIALSWTAPWITGGVAISGYKIEVSADSGTTWSDLVANTGTTDLTYAHTGLSGGDTRHYRVSAINSAGTGPASDVASATISSKVELSVNPGAVAEDAAGTSVTVTGTLDGTARTEATTVTVSIGAAADTATEGTDYTTVDDLTLTISAEQTSGTATFTLTPENDTLGDGDETISVTGTTTATGLTVTGTELTITDDETVSTEVELSVNLASVAEDAAAGTVVTVTGTLDSAARTEATSVTVSIGAATDTATEGTDYTTVDDLTLTISAEQTSGTATFTLTPDNDTLGEGDEKISVTGTTTATDLRVTDTELTIADDETVSTEVELSVSHPSVAEDAAAGTVVTVTGTLDSAARTEATSVTVSVGAPTDTATEGTDYTTVNDLTLTISAEQTSGTATFTLTPDNDTLGDGDEMISVTGTTTAQGLTVTGTELTITDDDTASTEVELSVSHPSVAEDAAAGTVVTVTGTLDSAARTEATSVTVSIGAGTDTATEGTDYTTVNDLTLTINAEQTSGTATFTLTPDNDTLGDGDETISVTGTTTAQGLTVTGTELTITDDDRVSTEVELSVSLTSVAEDAAGTSVTVTGTLDSAARTEATSVTVSIGAGTDTATEGTDYTTVNDLTLTIGTGQTSGTATFTLTPDNDTLGEGDEKISVTGTTTATGLTVTGTELTITDDETVSTEVELSVSHQSVAEDAAAGTVVTVTGTLNGGARTEATSVTVSIGAGTDTATEGTDYTTVNDLTLTISAEQTSGTATFTLTPDNNTLGEGDETISVTGTTTAAGLTVTGTELTITDDETVSTEVELSVSHPSVAEDAAAGTVVTVTGTLNGGALTEATTVTVSIGAGTDTATEGTDYTTVDDRTLTISAGETSGTATFTLTPTNDELGEGGETVSVGGTTTAAGLTVSGTELTITDDDSASTEVKLSVSPASVAENAAGTAVTVTGILDGAARTEATSVTVSVGAPTDTATEGTDYTTVNNFTLTINAEQASGTATFTLTPRNDTLGEGAEQISVTGTTTAAGLTVSGTELTITDNDTASTEVALSVRPRSVAENAAGTSVTVTGTLNGGSRTSDTRVTVSVGASTDSATEGTDYTTVEDFTLTIDGGQTSGTATFTLTPDNDTLGEGASRSR